MTRIDSKFRQHGTVLVFKAIVSKEEIERIIASFKDKLAETPHVHAFDPEYGGPVWYIP